MLGRDMKCRRPGGRGLSTPATGAQLTGTSQPDGRKVDPNVVTNLSPRNAMLNSFQNLPASGDWTLFVADVSSGDTHTLQSWGLTITGSDVPEPSFFALAAGAAVLMAANRRRR
jgi:subtilisin-like proprotein convertase family protein